MKKIFWTVLIGIMMTNTSAIASECKKLEGTKWKGEIVLDKNHTNDNEVKVPFSLEIDHVVDRVEGRGWWMLHATVSTTYRGQEYATRTYVDRSNCNDEGMGPVSLSFPSSIANFSADYIPAKGTMAVKGLYMLKSCNVSGGCGAKGELVKS